MTGVARGALAGLLVLVAEAAPAQDAPRAIERQAHAAFVQQGGEASLRSQWASRLERSADDRAARFGLAVMDDLAYRYESAAAGYGALSSSRVDRYAVAARLAWARMDELRGRMGDAAAGYDTARALARRIGDRESEGIVLLALAFLRANSEGIEPGTATLDSAERMLPNEPPVLADLARRRATLLAVQLDPRAHAIALEGVRLARRAADPRMEANAVRALALDYKMRGIADSASQLLEEAARLQRLAGDRRALAETLVRVADLHITNRRLGEARVLLLEAEAHATASRNDYALASVATGLGSLALRVRDLSSASRYLARAASLNVESNDSASLVIVQGLQSVAAFQAGLLDTAWTLRQAVLRAYEMTNEIPDAVASHQALSAIAQARGDLAAAHRALDAGEALLARHRVPALGPQLGYHRARLHLYEARDAEAEQLLRRYVAQLGTDDLVARWDAAVDLAGIRARGGDAAGAARDLGAAADALERWRMQQGDSALRLFAFQVAAHEGGTSGGHFARAVAAIAAGGEVDAAFGLAERQRARTLAERLEEARLLRPVTSRAGPTTAVRAQGLADAMTAAALRLAIPSDSVAVLEFVTGRDGAPTTLFVLTRAAVRAIPLPSADSLAPSLRLLLAMLERGEDARPLRRAMGQALLATAIGGLHASVTSLVVIPDGALHRVPFDALVLRDGRALLERFEVSIAPSATIAASLWSRVPAARTARVFAVGDPGRDASGSVASLPEARREARAVSAFGDASRTLIGSAATASAIRATPLRSFSVLHFATHATVDERSLMRSAIMLAPENGTVTSLGPGDIAALPMQADLVVLSSCRSAGGVVIDGEGVQGLTAPLLAAGVRSVVASSWDVDDRQTRLIVEDFYRGLSRGLTVGGALRAAKLAAMERGAPPRDWAAFTVIGDARVRMPLDAPVRTTAWLSGAAALSAAGIGAFLVGRRRKPEGASSLIEALG